MNDDYGDTVRGESALAEEFREAYKPEPKIDTFTVKGRRQEAVGKPWSPWSSIGKEMSPREARAVLISHAAFMTEHSWEIVGISRAEITMETPSGARYELRMSKEVQLHMWTSMLERVAR